MPNTVHQLTAEQLRISEEARTETEEIFKLLVSEVQDYAIFALDPAGNILTWNLGAERLNGYTADEIIGSHFSRFYTPEDIARRHPENELQIASRIGKYEEEGWRVRKDGSRFLANVVITALKDPDGKLRGFAKVTRDLTERKASEQARLEEQRQATILKEAEEREKLLDLVFSQAPSFMTLLSVPDYRYLKSNEKHFQLMQRWDIIGKKITEVDPELEKQGFIQILDEVVRTGAPYVGKQVPVTYHDSKGFEKPRTVYVDFVYQPLRKPNGEIYAISAQGYDVTEIVHSRKAVENERQNFRNLFKQTPEMVCILNGPNHVFESVNEAYIRALGFDATGMSVRVAQPESVEVHGILDDVYRTGKTAQLHELPVTLTNRLRYFNLTYAARRNDAGEIIGVMTLGIEVTDQVQARRQLEESLQEQRRADEALQASENRLRTLIDSLPQLVWSCLPSGECDYLSQQWIDYTGLPLEEQLGFKWLDRATHPEDRERVLSHWTDAVNGICLYDLEFRIRRYDGAYRWFKTRGTPVRNRKGEIVHWFGTCTDIEDQKRNLEVLATLNEVGPTISAELDLNRVVQRVTDAGTKLSNAEFGAFFYNVFDSIKGESYTLYTLSGAPREAFSNFEMPRKTEIFEPTFSGKGIIRSDDIRKDPRYGKNDPHFGMPKGHLPVVSYLAVPVISRSGEVLGGLFFGHSKSGIFSQQTEEVLKGLAAQAAIAIDNARLYQQSQDAVRSRDEFLSIASHELKTPLAGMKLQTQMFNRAVTKNSPSAFDPTKVKQVMGIMDKGLNRLVRLVDDMLDISRIQVGKLALLREEEDITSVVAETMQRLLPELSNAGIELRMNLAPHILCDLDRFRFEQVLTNLTTNAIRYAPNAPLDVKLEKIDDRILLRFQDHGPGIPETDREKIFVRFERLVSANQISGMGLGLFICREIIEGHGGTIRVDGENSSGACFIITLPQRSASQ